MGLSSNQARFLSLTSRQIDMEQRIQQICQRRLRLSSELENVATSYNNSISNRKMFTASQTNQGINNLSLSELKKLGYKLINATTKAAANSPIKAIQQKSEAAATAAGYTAIHNAQEFKTLINSNTAGNYILESNIDFSELGTLSTSVIQGSFFGTLDGNGYTMKNLSISTSSKNYIGLVDGNSGTIKNIALENANITNAGGNYTAAIVGINHGTIDNSYATGNISSTPGGAWTGGITGSNETGGIITNCWTDADVSGNVGAGGISGASANGNGTISGCYSLGDTTGTDFVGGIVGVNRDGNAVIKNCYATGDVSGTNYVGGIAGANYDMAHSSPLPNQIVDCYYADGTVSGTSNVGAVVGLSGSGYTSTGSFYTNTTTSSDSSGATQGVNTTGWDTSVWDTSTALPSLISDGLVSGNIEEGLRNGTYSLAKVADEFTQDPLNINGSKYEEVDWRTAPEIYDELNQGDDAAAEDKYDRTIDEINSQDKKLQLEQTSIETEYKAVTSEKEAVKKILDTNASSSFKYFS